MDIQAPDLTQTFPRSPRDTSIAGYVVAARALDQCQAVIAQSAGGSLFLKTLKIPIRQIKVFRALVT